MLESGHIYLLNSLTEHWNLNAIVYEKNEVGGIVLALHDCVLCCRNSSDAVSTVMLGQWYMICKLQVLFEGETIEQTLWNRLQKTYKNYTD